MSEIFGQINYKLMHLQIYNCHHKSYDDVSMLSY